MAYYFGINDGAGVMGNITEGATTTSKDVEIVINTNANVPTKEELILSVEKLLAYLYVASKNW